MRQGFEVETLSLGQSLVMSLKSIFQVIQEINFNTGIYYKLTDDAIAWWDRDEIIYEGESYELFNIR